VVDARWRTGSVHAYGEMVGVLAARGDVVSALELEALWSRLVDEHPFRLLCGYPRDIVGEANPVFDDICGAHDAVIVTREPTDLTLSATVDLPIGPEAPSTACRAARELLSAWGIPHTADEADAGIVVSELVTAAGRGGSRRVTLKLGLDAEHVVISVTGGAGPPGQAAKDVVDLTEAGRLFSVLSTVAQSWGVQAQPDGRRLWARIRSTRSGNDRSR
jgi:hypothetical protein